MRAERIPDPEVYIDAILKRAEHKHIYDVYGIREWEDYEDFINQVAVRTGKLLRGGEPDINNISKSIIMDWQRGNIPYFEFPPRLDEDGNEIPYEAILKKKELEDKELGEQAKKEEEKIEAEDAEEEEAEESGAEEEQA